MAIKAKKRKPERKLPPLSRAELLPLAAAQARDQSLRAHMALVMVRSGHGDLSVLGELLRTVFVTYFVCKSGGEVSGSGTNRSSSRKFPICMDTLSIE